MNFLLRNTKEVGNNDVSSTRQSDQCLITILASQNNSCAIGTYDFTNNLLTNLTAFNPLGRIIIFTGVSLLLAGFLGWTVPVSSNNTIAYWDYFCKSGSQYVQGLSCSSIHILLELFYVLVGTGFALTIIGAFWKRKKIITK